MHNNGPVNNRPTIVALDNSSADHCFALALELNKKCGAIWFKVGLELYTQAGPDFIRKLKDHGFSVFLDLKLHDIPNTVEKAARHAERLGADMLTVHALGGRSMISAAAQSLQNTALLAVTILTSHSNESLVRMLPRSVQPVADPDTLNLRSNWVLGLAQLSAEAGASGLVCSVPDLMFHKSEFLGHSWLNPPLFVTPGIREAGGSSHDQSSIASPQQARAAGATHIVVGRSITESKNESPSDVYKRISKEFSKGE